MNPITEYLISKGFSEIEGNSSEIVPQIHALYYLSKHPVSSILEIGFNAGHSSHVFLQHPTTQVLSLDLGVRPYVSYAKEWIDEHYPGRHTLLLGDSTQTLPQWIADHPNRTYDLIFIDGGHEEPTVRADIDNCLRLARTDTLILMDDVVYTDTWQADYTLGPTRVWKEYVEQGRIQELGHYDYAPGRGMSWGRALTKSLSA